MKKNLTASKPAWLKRRLPADPAYESTRALIKENRLHTVCQEAKCPNLWECFSQKTATFLIMGPSCSRNCRFCAVGHLPLHPPDMEEPGRIATAVERMNLSYVVITSVTRDDLADGGAGCFAQTIQAIRKKTPGTLIEVLIPDFQGDLDALQTVIRARPDVLNHNLETISRLYPIVRPAAEYQRSLDILRQAKSLNVQIPTKSGLMLGLGETEAETLQTFTDIRASACDILTVGQYLQPSKNHMPVSRYLTPAEFRHLTQAARRMGFAEVAGGPLVRSSYRAADLFLKLKS